jgi:hypothetical protein
MIWSSSAIGSMRRVATIATMASRLETFRKVLPMIHAQVDHLYVYLDGYTAPPDFMADFDRITVRRAEECGDLHCSSRFLCLKELNDPTVVVVFDDDIVYPPDYVARMVEALQQLEGAAVVGVHGRLFLPPHQSYARNVATLHFTHQLPQARYVHELGTGTCAFISSNLDVDPRQWDDTHMDDIIIAIEAQRRGLPRVALARAAGWLRSHPEHQDDTLWDRTLNDDAEQSRRMRDLLRLYADAPPLKEHNAR